MRRLPVAILMVLVLGLTFFSMTPRRRSSEPSRLSPVSRREQPRPDPPSLRDERETARRSAATAHDTENHTVLPLVPARSRQAASSDALPQRREEPSFALADTLYREGRTHEAVELFAERLRQVEAARALDPETTPAERVAIAQCDLAAALWWDGRRDDAWRLVDELSVSYGNHPIVVALRRQFAGERVD